MKTLDISITLNMLDCCECGAPIVLAENLERSLRESHKNFYCPSGHPQHFSALSEAEKLRKKLNEAELAQTRQANAIAEKQAEIERMSARAASGVCPCCNRTFKQLAAHMGRKHPTYGRKS